VAAASDELAQQISDMLPSLGSATNMRIDIKVGETSALMQRAHVGIVASGSATLEAAFFRMPFALVYKVAWPTYLAGRLVVNVNYLGMPNLLAGKEVVPEFIQHRARPEAIAESVPVLMEDAHAREQMISQFDAIMAKIGFTGASENAAQTIIHELKERRARDRRADPEIAIP
jgi:lipid-A-disaccharide synthase